MPSLAQKTAFWERELLDLSKRNRMLHFRETRRSSLVIEEPDFFTLYQIIVKEEKCLSFRHAIGREVDSRAYSLLQLLESAGSPVEALVGDIRTNQSLRDQMLTLRSLRNKAKLAFDEQGTNLLYLAFGFIHWYDGDKKTGDMNSPFLLVPVVFSEDNGHDYRLKTYDDDITINPTLVYALEQKKHFEFPEFDSEKDSFQEYLAQLIPVLEKAGMRFEEKCCLGILSFLKINMYLDLKKNHDRIATNPVLREIYMPGAASERPVFDHDARPYADSWQVLSADSSQLDAIALSRTGKSFVLQGPPGTGKSQTITNIIAQALADGRRVLFVSEKMAALQVVYRRLEEVGLADFCLPLHDYKADKKKILNQIAQPLSLSRKPSFPNASTKLARMENLKEQLNLYARDMHGVQSASEMSLYEAISRLEALGEIPGCNVKIDAAHALDWLTVLSNKDRMAEFGRVIEAMTIAPTENPWNGYRLEMSMPKERQKAREQIDIFLQSYNDALLLAERAREEFHIPVQARPGELQHMGALLTAILRLPALPQSWFDEEIDTLRAEAERQRNLQKCYRENKEKVDGFFVTCPTREKAEDWLKQFDQSKAKLMSIGEDINHITAMGAAYHKAMERLDAFSRAWEETALPYWTASRPVAAAKGLYALLSSVDGLSVFSPLWLQKNARKQAARVFQTSCEHQQNIQRLCAALAERNAGNISEASLSEAYSAWREPALSELPPIVVPILERDWQNGRPGMFAAMPTFSVMAWCARMEQLVESLKLSRNISYDKVEEGLAACGSACEALATIENALGPFWALFPDKQFGRCVTLLQALPALNECLPAPASWAKKENREKAFQLIDQLIVLQKEINRQREAVLNEYYITIFQLDATSMLHRFEREYNTILGWLNPQKKKDLRSLQMCRKSTTAVMNDSEAVQILKKLYEIGDMEHAYRALWAQDGRLLADAAAVVPQDLDGIKTALNAFHQMCQKKQNGCIESMTEEMLRAVPGAVETMGAFSVSDLNAALNDWMDDAVSMPVPMLRQRMARQCETLREMAALFQALSGYLKPDVPRRKAYSAMKALAQAQDHALMKAVELTRQLAEERRAYDALAEQRERWLAPAIRENEIPWDALHDTLEILSREDLQGILSEIAKKSPDISIETLREWRNKLADFAPEDVWHCILDANKKANIHASASSQAEMLRAGSMEIEAIQQLLSDVSFYVPEKASLADIADHMRSLTELYRTIQAGDDGQERCALLFSDLYVDWNTDWEGVLRDLKQWNTCLTRYPEIKTNIAVYRPIIAAVDRDDYEIWAGRTIAVVSAWQESSAEIETYFEDSAFSGLTLSEREERLADAFDHMEYLDQWLRYALNRNKIEEIGLSDVVSAFETNHIPPLLYGPAYEKAFLTAWINEALMDKPELIQFDAREADNAIDSYRRLSDDFLKINRVRLRAALIDRVPRQEAGGEMAILKKELSKKARIMPLRKLFRQIPYLLMKLKPCLMMSPLSVSYFLDSDFYHFDLIIFDEASQIFPQDAIGAILRGDQAIIAGDTKQMPPTDFFSVEAGQEEQEDEDEISTPLGDSILEEADFTLTPQQLLWHYRSRDEQLIAFSNRHFYDGMLYTFPANTPQASDTGVEFVYVPDGVYEKRHNDQEAKICLDLIRTHFEAHSDRSLGVVAFSEAQQSAIENLVWEARERDPAFANRLDANQVEPFFIKNLENVQGDERDTIIFSVCFSRARDGKFRYNFGPLGRAGGERRLNVAVTRAKHNVKLVASIHAEDIDLNRAKSEGAKLLRTYIDYAAHPERAWQTETPMEDGFVDSVAKHLEAQGYAVQRHVGCSAYKVDIAVRSRENPSQYLAAVQCDGKNYASARTACDRETIRRGMLENLNWRIINCWSAEWLTSPETAHRRLTEQLKRKNNLPKNMAPKVVEISETTGASEPVIDIPAAVNKLPEYRSESDIRYRSSSYSSKYGEFARRTMHCIRCEQPISPELLYKRMAKVWDRKMVNAFVRDRVNEQLKALGDDIRQVEGFYVLSGFEAPEARTAGDREIDQISIAELEADLSFVIRQAFGMTRQEVLTSTARLMGYQRTGSRIISRLNEALERLCTRHKITIVHDKVQWMEEDT